MPSAIAAPPRRVITDASVRQRATVPAILIGMVVGMGLWLLGLNRDWSACAGLTTLVGHVTLCERGAYDDIYAKLTLENFIYVGGIALQLLARALAALSHIAQTATTRALFNPA